MASAIYGRPVTQEQIDAAKRRRAEKLNEKIKRANDYVLTDLMTRIADLEAKAEGNEPK